MIKTSNDVQDSVSSANIKLLSFNCKNIKTSGTFFQDFEKDIDIFLVQEHWLFHCELDLINEIHPNLVGTGKSVDMNDPILPNSMPRGYGGVAILRKKSIDQYIRPTSDGSERIQCIEINTETPHLIINVYLPLSLTTTKSNNDQFDTYSDCFDQL